MAQSDAPLDVVIIGAGISGINSGYRIQESYPELKYTILEARESLGGTWDLFKYPGIRSDSSMQTFGFQWYPWTSDITLAGGEAIKNYMSEAAHKFGIDEKIKYGVRVNSAHWSSDTALWRLETESAAGTKQIYAKWLFLGTGYYDYEHALQSKVPGLEQFQGTVIHPQFWPGDYDPAGKNIVVIGSGATAVTLVPALAQKGAFVTMLQRSPTYIATQKQTDPFGVTVNKYLPASIARPFLRFRSLLGSHLVIKICQIYPQIIVNALRKATIRLLPPSIPHDPHFVPRYKPWEQRFCLDADGDLFRAMRREKATIVTDTIKQVKESSIELSSGQTLRADTIVTATGLQIKFAGGIKVYVDQKPVTISDQYVWRMSLVQDVPNLAVFFGYANTSWTLGTDVTWYILNRLFKHMRRTGKQVATPHICKEEEEKLEQAPTLGLSSTYVQRAKSLLPKTATTAPWQPRGTYFGDLWDAYFASVTKGIEFKAGQSL